MIPRLANYGGYSYMIGGEERNIVDTLYDEERYEGEKIKKMNNSDLIKAVVDLRKNAKENKLKVEYYFLDNKKEIKKYKTLFQTKKDFLLDLAKTETMEWLGDLPLYDALVNEIVNRELGDYLDIVLEREGL